MSNKLHQFPPAVRVPHHGVRRWIKLVLLVASFTVAPMLSAQSLEYRVKAGFIFNFAKFVEWPQTAGDDRESVTIGVMAPIDIFEIISEELSDRTLNGLPVKVVPFDSSSPPAPLPQLLFIHKAANELTPAEQKFLSNHHVLMIGESPDFAARQGIIGFVPRGDSLRFQVNIAAAERAGLQLSGQLARLAEIVRDSR